MLKVYVCFLCHGSGEIWSVDDESNNIIIDCMDCKAKGLPSQIEIAISGPPAAKEMVIDAEFVEVTMPVLEEPK